MHVDEVIADLMSASGDRLLRLAYQLCHDRAGAEDLVQEALTRVYGSWLRRRPDIDSAEAYLRRAIVNEYLRRRRLKSSTEVVTAAVPDTADNGFDDAVVDHDQLWRALGSLPARQRAVLVLRFYEDLPDGEIALLIDAKEGTVRSLASRALQTLREGSLIEDTAVIDDDLRAVMRDHDVEAPSAADFLARHDPADTRLRKKRWIATGAAAACVAAIAVVVSITGLPAEHRPTSFPHGTNSTSTSQPASGSRRLPSPNSQSGGSVERLGASRSARRSRGARRLRRNGRPTPRSCAPTSMATARRRP